MGKDTFANMLCEEFELRQKSEPSEHYTRMIVAHHAWPLKQVAHIAFGWAGVMSPEYYNENPQEKSRPLHRLKGFGNKPGVIPTVRDVLIEVGYMFRNEFNPDTWVNALYDRLNEELGEILYETIVVLPDTRFPNEYREVKSRKGLCVMVENDNVEKTSDSADDALDGWKWDHVIKNNGTLEDLRQSAGDFLDYSGILGD